MRAVVPILVASLSLVACNDSQRCPGGCVLGSPLVLTLVDAAGNRVAARGEYQVEFAYGGGQYPTPFDCTVLAPDASAAAVPCEAGVVTLSGVYGVDEIVEVRFELEPGVFSEWERLPPQYTTAETCLCNSEVRGGTALVPATARRPLPE